MEAGSSANTNFGTSTLLLTKKKTSDSNSIYNRASYIKFDLTGLTTVSAATLQLTVSATSNPSNITQDVQINYVSDTAWTESGLTWNNAPGLNRANFTTTGTTITTVSVQQQPAIITIDLTAFVQAHRGQVVTLQLIDATAQDVWMGFNSREAASGGPKLIVR